MKIPTRHFIEVPLEVGMIAFFILAALSLLVVYLADPAMYTQSLSLTSSPAERYPVLVTLFLVGVFAVIALLILGVVRHWRWLFWLILIAFASSIIQIPVEGLQLLGVFPNPYPVWYCLFRGGVGLIELGLAFWMIQTYQHQGVWAMGKKKAGQMSHLVRTELGLIEYRSVGQGPVVLVLNGGHTNCNSPLGHEAFFLAQGYQLIVPSRPGYGKTPSSTGKRAEAFADALVSLLDHLQLDRVIVVGISAGGPTALQLAGRHPERVSKVILQNAATDGRYASGMIRFLTYVFFNLVLEGVVWASFRGLGRVAPQAALKSVLLGLSCLPPNQVLAMMSPAQQQAALAFLLASRSGSGFLHDISHRCGDLGRITAPVLIITSKYDGLVDSSHATYAHTHIPQAQLFVSLAESHLMWFSSHDDEIRARMQAFLQS
ncbi:MAG TPA: alpha/beta hydrolase [Ktedonobacteraceae bacterium]